MEGAYPVAPESSGSLESVSGKSLTQYSDDVADPEQEQTTQLGLLDLTIDLSVPQVYSGTDFTVYLHIKNPFSLPVWIDAVELSLPTQLYWRVPVRPKLTDEQHSDDTGGATDVDRVHEYLQAMPTCSRGWRKRRPKTP